MAVEEDALGAGGEDVTIDEMRVEDVDQVVEIERLSYRTPWSRRAFLSELRDNAYADYIVARCGGRVVGYAGMWLLFDEAHITNIAVHPAYRGRKIGDLLLSQLERRAARRGMKSMTLEVRPSNPVAQALYRKHGFVPRGIRRGYYSDTREDAIIMWKDGLEDADPGHRDELR